MAYQHGAASAAAAASGGGMARWHQSAGINNIGSSWRNGQ
jgi:hypothetical protein